ncbi:MAG: YkgJ family cysteine cluster protein [Blastocatellia bacterium]
MSGRELPVLNFSPFRRYPTRLSRQEYDDERRVCGDCLSGACCASEDPIHLTSFDVFRLAAFFDLSPAEFLRRFTQDRFAGEDSETRRRLWVEDAESSTVTFLRRRANSPTSPCIFLKYVRDHDGTPRRVCGVHEARPLACREYYYDTCKTRWTGEIAALLAEGFEKLRDGEINEARIDAELARFSAHDCAAAPLSASLERHFWMEMKRAVDPDRSNSEGAASYRAADYQDPAAEKLNRILSVKHLRFEEKYGPRPHGEQLMPYAAGLGFAGSAERARLLTIVRKPPSAGLFSTGDYPFYVAHRAMLPGVKAAAVFAAIPDGEIRSFLKSLPDIRLFPRHEQSAVRRTTLREVYAAGLKGYNHLIRVASYFAAMGRILEVERPGQIEASLLTMLAGFGTSLNPYLADNPYFRPVKLHLAHAAFAALEEALGAATSPAELFMLLQMLSPLGPLIVTLPPRLRRRGAGLLRQVRARLRVEPFALPADFDNPIAARQAAGRRLDAARAANAWQAWRGQLLGARCAAQAGCDLDLRSFYRQSVADLENIPFRRGYAPQLWQTVRSLAFGLSDFNRLACRTTPLDDAAVRLAGYALRLFAWMAESDAAPDDSETLAEWLTAVHKGLGLSYNQDPHFGVVVRRLLDEQLQDGSWGTNPRPDQAPESQAEYLIGLYHTTWTCLDALRPIKTDLQNPENAALGLV